jgi:hypothetical protein
MEIQAEITMTNERAWNWPQIYLGVMLTTLATLILELSLTRIFPVVFFYHFAVLAISVALFGIGLGEQPVHCRGVPDASTWVYTSTFQPQKFKARDVAEFLRLLLRHLWGPVILLWDLGSIHQGLAITAVQQAYPPSSRPIPGCMRS